MNPDCHDRLELLARLAHDRWSCWLRYEFRFGKFNDDGTFTLDAAKVKRWLRQMETDYNDLSEAEKESDRIEARMVLACMREAPDVQAENGPGTEDQLEPGSIVVNGVDATDVTSMLRVEIDPSARYILLCKGTVSMQDAKTLSRSLQDWWDSDRKFYLIGIADDVEVQLERLEDI